MKVYQILSVTAVTFGLVACGGGGGSGTSNPAPTTIPTNNNIGNAIPDPRAVQTKQIIIDKTSAGDMPEAVFDVAIKQFGGKDKILALDGTNVAKDGNYTYGQQSTQENSNSAGLKDSVKYNGATLPLEASYTIWNSKLNNSAIALIQADAGTLGNTFIGKNVALALYSGKPTLSTDIENVKGKATYQGVGFLSAFLDLGGESKAINSVLTVDFDNKTISGYLQNSRYLINLNSANLVTSEGFVTFSGTTNEKTNWGFKNGTYTGQLMGQNADEVVGSFIMTQESSNTKLGGVFNGTKQ